MTSPIDGPFSIAGLRARFALTQVPRDPLDVSMPPDLGRWPRAMRQKLEGPLTPAGVLVPVMQRSGGLSVLLTQRAAHLKHHAGQVSFPGGRMEEHDDDVQAAALREAHEEVGIEPHHVDVIGCLNAMPTITGFAVTPVVGLVSDSVQLIVDRTEVEYAFEVPLAHLMDDANDRFVDREYEGRSVSLVEFHYEGERIWGATAQMLVLFRNFVLNK